MHIHGAGSLQYAALLPTQQAQQTQVERRVAAEIRRKLITFGGSSVEDELARAEAYAEGERQRQKQDEPPDEEAFRQILISFNA